jgi:hypothetical protein
MSIKPIVNQSVQSFLSALHEGVVDLAGDVTKITQIRNASCVVEMKVFDMDAKLNRLCLSENQIRL